MMTKKQAEQIVKLWNKEFSGVTPETQTEARMEKNCSGWSIEIHQAGGNDGRAFYHTREKEFTSRERALEYAHSPFLQNVCEWVLLETLEKIK